MAIIKCKMCGGDLLLVEGKSVAACEFCGSVQTVPVADSDVKLNLFTRANRLRADCDFDKAANVYESIVSQFPQEAEAYWGLVLCKYGIEYVDDPGTGKKVPTCHRTLPKPVLEDSDFREALVKSQGDSAGLYKREAGQINEIQQKILRIVANEAPYDVFICYKETDDDTLRRTEDSSDAQDLFTELTKDGYRVFFARNTLKSVAAGSEYEPYIYAALSSAKVMLVIGSREEYFNAVWVKNEWARFLDMMKTQPGKVLIPCCKNIEPYDMPREFRNLQALNMTDLTFYSALKANLERAIPRQKAVPAVVQERVVVGGSGDNKIASLLDRGNMALEDGDWAKADSFFEDVLNNDSKNAQAYLGKTLAQERCRTIDAFIRKRKENSSNVRSEQATLKPDNAHVAEMVKKCTVPGFVEGAEIEKRYRFNLNYTTDVPSRRKQYQDELSFWENHKLLARAEKFASGAVAENLQREKKNLFAELSRRLKEAEEAEKKTREELAERYTAHIAQADEQAEALHQQGLEAKEEKRQQELKQREERYQQLLEIAKSENDVTKLTGAAGELDGLGNYKDSKNLAEHCRARASEEQAKLDARCAAEEKAAAARRKKNTIIGSIVAVVAVVAIIAAVLIGNNIKAKKEEAARLEAYTSAITMIGERRYEEAIAAFEALGDYQYAAAYIQYVSGIRAYNDGDFVEAFEILPSLDEDYIKELSRTSCPDIEEIILQIETEYNKYEETYAAFCSEDMSLDDAKIILENLPDNYKNVGALKDYCVGLPQMNGPYYYESKYGTYALEIAYSFEKGSLKVDAFCENLHTVHINEIYGTAEGGYTLIGTWGSGCPLELRVTENVVTVNYSNYIDGSLDNRDMYYK